MNDAERTYVSAVAQILPVLGLALVLEMREYLKSWFRDRRKLVAIRRLQVVTFIYGGLSVALGTLLALGALRRDEELGPIESNLVLYATGAAIGTVLINPIINNALAAESQWLALSRISSFSFGRKLTRVRRQLRSFRGRAVANRSNSYRQLIHLERILSRWVALEQRYSRCDDTATQEGIREEIAAITSSVARARALWRECLIYEMNLALYSKEVDRVIKSVNRRSREATANGIIVELASWNGVDMPRIPNRGSVELSLPDDGGFFGANSDDLAIPRFRNESHLIADAHEFYDDGVETGSTSERSQ